MCCVKRTIRSSSVTVWRVFFLEPKWKKHISFTISSAVMNEVLVFLPGWHEIVTLLQSKDAIIYDYVLPDKCCLKCLFSTSVLSFYNTLHRFLKYLLFLFGLLTRIVMFITHKHLCQGCDHSCFFFLFELVAQFTPTHRYGCHQPTSCMLSRPVACQDSKEILPWEAWISSRWIFGRFPWMMLHSWPDVFFWFVHFKYQIHFYHVPKQKFWDSHMFVWTIPTVMSMFELFCFVVCVDSLLASL